MELIPYTYGKIFLKIIGLRVHIYRTYVVSAGLLRRLESSCVSRACTEFIEPIYFNTCPVYSRAERVHPAQVSRIIFHVA